MTKLIVFVNFNSVRLLGMGTFMKNALLIGVFSLALIIGSTSCNDQNPEEAVSWDGIEENEVFWHHKEYGESVFKKQLSLLDFGDISFDYKTDSTIEGLLRVPDVDSASGFENPVLGEDYYSFIIRFKDLPVIHTDKGIKLSSTNINAEFHPQRLSVCGQFPTGHFDALIDEDIYKGVMECSGTMDYVSDTELSGEWLFRIIMNENENENENEKVVIRVNKLKKIDSHLIFFLYL